MKKVLSTTIASILIPVSGYAKSGTFGHVPAYLKTTETALVVCLLLVATGLAVTIVLAVKDIFFTKKK